MLFLRCENNTAGERVYSLTTKKADNKKQTTVHLLSGARFVTNESKLERIYKMASQAADKHIKGGSTAC